MKLLRFALSERQRYADLSGESERRREGRHCNEIKLYGKYRNVGC